MKKIGFIDLFLSEWHANNYPGWLTKAAADAGKEYAVAYAYAEKNVSPYDGITTKEWCLKYGAESCETIEALCALSDCIIILSPDNPETHLSYAKAALKFGKPTYIDKTFAPDKKTAEEIFRLSEEYGSPMFSTSALGCADELARFIRPAGFVSTTGGGASLERYCVHQIEMITSLMGAGAKRVMSTVSGTASGAVIDYGGGRAAQLWYSPGESFSVSAAPANPEEGSAIRLPVQSDYFGNLMREIIKLFETGQPSVEKARTLEVAAIREALLLSQRQIMKWVTV